MPFILGMDATLEEIKKRRDIVGTEWNCRVFADLPGEGVSPGHIQGIGYGFQCRSTAMIVRRKVKGLPGMRHESVFPE
jgi:hypothetical protein